MSELNTYFLGVSNFGKKTCALVKPLVPEYVELLSKISSCTKLLFQRANPIHFELNEFHIAQALVSEASRTIINSYRKFPIWMGILSNIIGLEYTGEEISQNVNEALLAFENTIID